MHSNVFFFYNDDCNFQLSRLSMFGRRQAKEKDRNKRKREIKESEREKDKNNQNKNQKYQIVIK